MRTEFEFRVSCSMMLVCVVVVQQSRMQFGLCARAVGNTQHQRKRIELALAILGKIFLCQ